MPRPNYNDIRRNFTIPTHSLDPRLRRIFSLTEAIKPVSMNHIGAQESYSLQFEMKEPSNLLSRLDPRLKKENLINNNVRDKNIQIYDFQHVLQESFWFKNLSSNQKITVNQNLADLTGLLKSFNYNLSTNKSLNIPSSTQQILSNLGVFIDELGRIQPINLRDNIISLNSSENTNIRLTEQMKSNFQLKP